MAKQRLKLYGTLLDHVKIDTAMNATNTYGQYTIFKSIIISQMTSTSEHRLHPLSPKEIYRKRTFIKSSFLPSCGMLVILRFPVRVLHSTFLPHQTSVTI